MDEGRRGVDDEVGRRFEGRVCGLAGKVKRIFGHRNTPGACTVHLINTSYFQDAALDSQEVLKECLDKFSTPDYIMEPGIFTQLKRYFQAGGTPEHVINLLSHNYTAVAQMTNLLAEWLITAGVKVTDVQAMVENHLKEMILKTFDPKKADTIFTEEGEVSGTDIYLFN